MIHNIKTKQKIARTNVMNTAKEEQIKASKFEPRFCTKQGSQGVVPWPLGLNLASTLASQDLQMHTY